MNIHLTQIYLEQYAKNFLLSANIFNNTFFDMSVIMLS
jgi:hypothetical protein